MNFTKTLAFTLAIFASVSAFAQTADEIIAKHVAARGGADKLNNIQTMVMEHVMSTQFGEFPITQTVVKDKSFRQSTDVMGTPLIMVVNGETGWSLIPSMMGGTGQVQDLPAESVKSMSALLDPMGQFNFQKSGVKAELVGKEKVENKDAYHLKLTSSDGSITDQWIDAGTYLIAKTKAVSYATGQPVNQEITYSNYKNVDGIMFAYTMETENPQAGSVTLTVRKVVLNGPVDPSIFVKPK